MSRFSSQKPDSAARSQRDQQASELAELGAIAPLYAHEVHNIMTMLSGRAQLALMRLDSQEVVEQVLEGVVEACERAARLSDLFLCQGKTEESDQERHELQAICDRVKQAVVAQPREHTTIELDVQAGLTPDAPPLVLEQVLDNLLRNAMRAIDEHPTPDDPAHRIRIRGGCMPYCSTWNTDTQHSVLRIVVEDSGVGITKAEAERLFRSSSGDRESHRAAGPRNARFPRHGLGLRVCTLLLESVGGTIECESTPNRGTRMIIHMPMVENQSAGHRSAA